MAVLLVEDDTMLRLILVEFLGETGLPILEAGNADDALIILNSQVPHIDILVTDLDLGPGDDGLILAAKARACLPQLLVIYATGSPEKLIGHDLAPWQSVFLKPFDPTALAAAVTALSKTICH